jgi:hypothetical protein
MRTVVCSFSLCLESSLTSRLLHVSISLDRTLPPVVLPSCQNGHYTWHRLAHHPCSLRMLYSVVFLCLSRMMMIFRYTLDCRPKIVHWFDVPSDLSPKLLNGSLCHTLVLTSFQLFLDFCFSFQCHGCSSFHEVWVPTCVPLEPLQLLSRIG